MREVLISSDAQDGLHVLSQHAYKDHGSLFPYILQRFSSGIIVWEP
ncbi:hypothetical protein K3495_g509 [Podosphaera aphanis]|nr:hypothetical protein K3495_g509 [Podosphaera aphanis]